MAAKQEYVFKKSKLLTQDDNERIKTNLGPRKECLAMTVAQISASNQTNSKGRERILCFIKDHATKSFFFYIYCSQFNLIWKEKLKKDLGYVCDNGLHIFKGEGLDIGIKFKSFPEGATFVKEVRSKFLLMDVHGATQLEVERKKKKKDNVKATKSRNKNGLIEFTVGDPKNFKHVTHISSIYLDKEDIKDVFLKAGIETEKLNSRLTKQLLEAVIEAEKNSYGDSTVSVPEIKIFEGDTKTKKKAPAPPRPPPPRPRPPTMPNTSSKCVYQLTKSNDFGSNEIGLQKSIQPINLNKTEPLQNKIDEDYPLDFELQNKPPQPPSPQNSKGNEVTKQLNHNIPREETNIPQSPPIQNFFSDLDDEARVGKPRKNVTFGVNSIIEQGKMLKPVDEVKVRPVEVEKRIDNLADIMRDFMSKIRPSIQNDDDFESDDNEWN